MNRHNPFEDQIRVDFKHQIQLMLDILLTQNKKLNEMSARLAIVETDLREAHLHIETTKKLLSL